MRKAIATALTGFIIQKRNNEFSLEILLPVIGAAGNIARSNIALAHLWLKLIIRSCGVFAYPPQTPIAGADTGIDAYVKSLAVWMLLQCCAIFTLMFVSERIHKAMPVQNCS